jgi:ELWxxDGT repeat protein
MSILVGDTLYFSANDGSSGTELWAHDTSNASTWQVADIYSGTDSSNPGAHIEILVGDTLYFSANDGSSGIELWAHDTSNASTWRVVDIRSGGDASSSNPGQYMSILVGDTLYFSADDGSSGHELWAHDTSNASTWLVAEIWSGIGSGGPGNGLGILVGDTLYFDAHDGDGDGRELWAHQPSEITSNTPLPASWETHPALPAGMSISGGTISGTPSVYANNQTYTIYANQSGYSTTHELYFSVDNAYPHTVVEDQPINAIGFHPVFWDGTTTWSISPSLPNTLLQDSATGEITGTVDSPMSDTFTVTATHSSGASETFTFSLESLLDTDGDGLANDLPATYNPANPPTPGLIADDDDDGDGLPDSVETDTGLYINGQDTGTDPLDPDTDDDGICDGPNAVPPICIAGPDPSPNGNTPPPTLVAVNNTAINDLTPYLISSKE